MEKIPREIRNLLNPPQKISIPDWIEANVVLPQFTSAEPGPLRISRTPYTRGPLLAMQSPFVEYLGLCWGRQLAKSQGVQYPFLCYAIAQDPGPAIFLLPTIDKAKLTSKTRLKPMFDACEAVAAQKTDDSDDYTTKEIIFRNMVFSMAWGGSETQLTSRPARYLLRDEIDELKKAVGQNAVDPLSAIEQTTSNFANRKILDTSTPTTPEGNIWKALTSCQYVFEYWVPCLLCGRKQLLYWTNVKFGDDHDPVVVEEVAYYECESCQGKISNLEKIRMLADGEWRARTTPDPCGQILKRQKAQIEETISLEDVLNNRRAKRLGFHLPKWYSPFSGGTFGVIAKEFLEANRKLQDGEDYAPMRNWTIYNAAVPYEERAHTETEIELLKNKIDLAPLVCPAETLALTCGFDPGQGGFWYSVVSWKGDGSPHLVDYGFMVTNYDSGDLDKFVLERSYAVTGGSKRMLLWRAGIDTGGSQYDTADMTMTAAAYAWIRRMGTPWLFGTKGLSTDTPRRLRETRIDKMPGDRGEMIPGGLMLVEINSGLMKDVLWFHLGIKEGNPGRFTFHNQTDTEFIRHLLAEEKRLQRNGKWEWVKKRAANHWLDATIIALVLGDPSFRGGVRVLTMPKPPAGGSGQFGPGNDPWIQKQENWFRR